MLQMWTPYHQLPRWPDLVPTADVVRDEEQLARLSQPDELETVRLDLRDKTARAHAAWLYVRVDKHGSPRCIEALQDAFRREPLLEGKQAIHGYMHTLRRMACGDPSVTVAEARAALDWAHAASGGGAG
jgi:hypothetical protein